MFEQLLGQLLTGGVGNRGRQRARSGFGSGFGSSLSRSTKTQIGVGAIGLAIAAWEHFKSKPQTGGGIFSGNSSSAAPNALPPPPPPMSTPSNLAPVALPQSDQLVAAGRESDAAHLIRAMIAAANADGQIDAEERAVILQHALEAGLDPAAQKFLMAELKAPATLEQIVAVTRPELRMDTYAAALVAISVDTDAERGYLARLAQALALEAAEVERVHEQVAAHRGDH